MTFQVVLVGSNGVLVGSDRKLIPRPPNIPEYPPFLQPDEQKKFITSVGDSIICAYSGDIEAQRLARSIVRAPDLTMSDLDWLSYLDTLAKNANVPGYYQKLIVVRKDRLNHAVVMSLNYHAMRIDTRQCVGVQSPACFLTNNYYNNQLSVKEMRELALLTLDRAATDFPTTVGDGYDLAFITKDGAEWVNYGPGDAGIIAARQSFDRAALGVIYSNRQGATISGVSSA
jgi:20S proteasome alpha/beta subunit